MIAPYVSGLNLGSDFLLGKVWRVSGGSTTACREYVWPCEVSVAIIHCCPLNPFLCVSTTSNLLGLSMLNLVLLIPVLGAGLGAGLSVSFSHSMWIVLSLPDILGRSVSAGMYIYTIQAGDFRQVRKMVLLK